MSNRLEELCKELGIETSVADGGMEKTASIAGGSEADVLARELSTENTITTNGGNTMGLTELFQEIFNDDMEKNASAAAQPEGTEVAQPEAEAAVADQPEGEVAATEEPTAEELEKTASELVSAGRFMARGFYNELEKLAAIPGQDAVSEHEKGQLHVEGAGGVQVDDGSQMTVNDPADRKTYENALKEAYVNAMLNKKKGVNVSGSVGQDNKVAPDAAK